MNHLVSTFCIGKYAPLAKYFTGITILDLTKLNDPEIISSFPYEHNLLIRLFLKEKSIEKILLWSPNASFNYNEDEDEEDDVDNYLNKYPPYEVISKIEGSNIINLCNKVDTSLYSSISPGKINIKCIQQVFEKIDNKNIDYIDLSWNDLYDHDLDYIVNAIKEFKLDINGINLSCNNFSGSNKNTRDKTYENLYYLLEHCEYVDLSMTPFASIDRLDFFKSLQKDSPSFLLTLIWIPEKWLETNQWQGMVCKELHYEIRDVHRQYYRWLKSLPLD
jgi:hypothetical protein